MNLEEYQKKYLEAISLAEKQGDIRAQTTITELYWRCRQIEFSKDVARKAYEKQLKELNDFKNVLLRDLIKELTKLQEGENKNVES